MTEPVDGELFKAEHRKSAVDSVIETVRDLLLTKQLKRGDRLPNEIELTKKLSTSRGSIREAMKILSSFGIVEIKRGDGTYISHSMSNRLFDHLVFQMILSDTDKKKLMELRELIEVGIIKIVIDNAQEEDIAAIREEYARMAERVEAHESDSAVLTELDLRFHRAIGMATKNELIRKVYDFTLDLFAPSIRQTHERPDKGRNALDHHRNILLGIEARDRERAEAAVTASIEQWVILSA
jgi:GntR family transcriptional regulator, transcriptional repressor for pyruvate dehydrogenase complex